MKIFDWLFDKNKKVKISKPQPPPKSNSITLSIDQWKRCIVDIAIYNPHEEISIEFGKMLYSLNAGLYEQKILDCMVDISKDYPFLKKNIQTALTSWAATIIEDENKNDNYHPLDGKPVPYIRPSLVFQKNH